MNNCLSFNCLPLPSLCRQAECQKQYMPDYSSFDQNNNVKILYHQTSKENWESMKKQI